MEKKTSQNNLLETGYESKNILEENLMPLVEIEEMERQLDNVETSYFFKGAVFCLIFCLPFWIILFKLIN